MYAITLHGTEPALATPAAPDVTIQTVTPTMCLKHADFHIMEGGCWSVTFDWYFTHSHLPETEARQLYQAEVERAMLDHLVRRLMLPHLVQEI